MPSDSKSDKPSFYISADANDAAKVVLVGVVTGLLVALIGMTVSRFFINPIFCGSDEAGAICAASGTVGSHVATILVNIIAVVALVKLSVYRPLLIALAAAASLWGIHEFLGVLRWYEYVFWFILFYGTAYFLFYWLARIRRFGVALIMIVLSVILVRVAQLL